MARVDTLLRAFLSDPIIKDKYGVDPKDYKTINDALVSKEPIVKAIAIILKKVGLETESDKKAIHQEVIGYLNRIVK